jgi:hypothetical protein
MCANYCLQVMGLPVSALSAAATLSAHAACPSWPTAERFTVSGEELTDKRTGLIWKRCSEGQTLSDNSCAGTAASYTHEQALARAKSANTADSATGWRLPNVKELASLADKGCQTPAIDSTAFPNTPSNWYWSSSPYVGGSSYAWFVDFKDGNVYYSYRYSSYQVRLVRASQ